jgi:hypothetical protein
VAEHERVRLEIAFDAAHALSVLVLPAVADALDKEIAAQAKGGFTFDAEDGTYTLALDKIVFVKRDARESRVGFGARG